MTNLNPLIPPLLAEYLPVWKTRCKNVFQSPPLSHNKKFRGVGSGRSVLILGNAPSLNNFPLDSVQKDMDIFACNDFFLHESFDRIMPSYYFNMDPRSIWFENLRKNVSPESLARIEFFLPFSRFNVVNKLGAYIPNVNYIQHAGSAYRNYSSFMSLSSLTLEIKNVLQILLLAAHYMQYDKAYLLGFDYSFLAFKNKHFIPHFHNSDPRAFKPALEEKVYTRMVCNVCKVLTALQYLQPALTLSVYNVGYETSFLDLFPPAPFSEICN